MDDLTNEQKHLLVAMYKEVLSRKSTISLTDKTIIYMENRFKNGLKDVLSFLSNFV